MEKATIKHILVDIGKYYLNGICNVETNTIIISISQFLENLVTAYVMVDLYVLDREEAKVKDFFWDLSKTTLHIYNEI